MHRKGIRLLGERGAAAVEFALVAPVLILLLLGIFEFGRAFHTQTALSAAAREGARYMAIHDDASGATEVTIAAAPSLPLTAGAVTVSPGSCTPESTVTVTASLNHTWLTGFVGAAGSTELTGVGVMRCGG